MVSKELKFTILGKEEKYLINIPCNVMMLNNIFKAFGKELRIVGGFIRDVIKGDLINQSSTDIDFVTSATIEEVLIIEQKLLFLLNDTKANYRVKNFNQYYIGDNIFSEIKKFKVIPTGVKYGTVTFVINDDCYEVTSLRSEGGYMDGRRPDHIQYTPSFEEDAMRRDFCINALYYSIEENKIYDYFGGLDDIANSRLAFIGNPIKRINEDYLRILRFMRFLIIFANDFTSKSAIDACSSNSFLLQNLSMERIRDEIDKMILTPFLRVSYNNGVYINRMHDIFVIMYESSMFSYIYKKEIKFNRFLFDRLGIVLTNIIFDNDGMIFKQYQNNYVDKPSLSKNLIIKLIYNFTFFYSDISAINSSKRDISQAKELANRSELDPNFINLDSNFPSNEDYRKLIELRFSKKEVNQLISMRNFYLLLLNSDYKYIYDIMRYYCYRYYSDSTYILYIIIFFLFIKQMDISSYENNSLLDKERLIQFFDYRYNKSPITAKDILGLNIEKSSPHYL
ncbi:MAG TPA: hypothetical protein QKA14_02630, partial [Candidatus Megaira endosymbiont of Hartmannula sinica]|nr:hypothetical protein [Candidatus Megaera endosymbiont of Hartmannula sinica]